MARIANPVELAKYHGITIEKGDNVARKLMDKVMDEYGVKLYVMDSYITVTVDGSWQGAMPFPLVAEYYQDRLDALRSK